MYQKKNSLWKNYLMHKSIVEKREIEKVLTEKTETTPTEQVRRMEEREALAKEASNNRSASKKLANNDWYERNKQWKKEYNAEYYQKNKDYWKKYYEYQRDSTNARARMAKERRDEANEALRKYGADSEEYKRLNRSANINEEVLQRHKGDLNAAALNYRKAQEEFNWATTTFAKTPISKIMSSGYSSIASAGKSFISNFKSGLSTLSSAISSGFSKLKSLFS